MIVKRGAKFVVISHQTGKSFGAYRSRKAAERRLKQVRYFKWKRASSVN